MASSLNEAAVETYVIDMVGQFATLYEDMNHPKAFAVRALANELMADEPVTEDRAQV